ncbi:transferrin receptor protein 1 [Pseudonaja textilis]|uniref:transferrin receptor protein 1 n=1 Tax=Pseudonaja textilis TaxID=8673 RepID=UPI000EAA1AA0|nr:transferrin receptor protein 1 [Pseudonaja textilis]
MDHARKAIFNMFGAEPLSYTRFSLARQPDGDSSRVEMKLSAEEEEAGENGMIDHLPPRKAKSRRHRHLCCVCGGVALLFLIGFLFGYISFRARMPPVPECSNGAAASKVFTPSEYSEGNNPASDPVLYWGDLKKLLADRLGKAKFEETIRNVSSKSHEAGSVRDEVLAYDIHKQFVSYNLDKVWDDEHYVRLQTRSLNVVSLENTENAGNRILESPSVFVAYGENGQVSGGDSYPYPYFGTAKDNPSNLLMAFSDSAPLMEKAFQLAAEIAGRMALRLTHDHELYLDYNSYNSRLQNFIMRLLPYQKEMKKRGLDITGLFQARGDFTRATTALTQDVKNTDLTNRDASRLLNDRLMKVEYQFLSPYVSPRETPFRHILLGSGSHTTQALLEHVFLLRSNASAFDEDLFKNQLALMTWTIQGAANALAGDVWDINNEL